MTHHRSRVCHFVIDCDDLDRATEFWSAALDTTEEPLSEQSRHIYRQLRLPDSEIRVLLQRTADAKVSKERMHLDLETDASRQRFSASRGSALHVGITSRSGATTSGCCVTPGATRSACCSRSSPSCWPDVDPGKQLAQCGEAPGEVRCATHRARAQ
jgi:Glyoxalase-like domain